MVFGRITEAVSDLKETLARVFRDPPSHSLEAGPLLARPCGEPPLSAVSSEPDYRLRADARAACLVNSVSMVEVPVRFEGRLQSEEAWARWAAGAVVFEMPVFAQGSQRRVEVPPLPRRPSCRRIEATGFRTPVRRLREEICPPAAWGGPPSLASPAVRNCLDLALGLPIAVQGQDVQALPRAQWMRYSLQLVKATGENIRNLEMLGVYRIPSKGVVGMRHDARTGSLLLELNRDASGGRRVPFLLARRRDDRTLVSCILEEG
jgi:hypothetical protein